MKNYFHCAADNVGDRACGPSKYFFKDQLTPSKIDVSRTVATGSIFGGGLIFGQIEKIANSNTLEEINSLVAWGVGIPPKGKRDVQVRRVAEQFGLFGTRNFEWKGELDFVPCSSCMDTAFDTYSKPSHEVVVFAHRKKTPDFVAPEGIPFLTNSNRPIQEVVDFISSGEVVVTSSYHGVFWAQLLRRKVLCIPFSDKFTTFEHNPEIASEANWSRNIKSAKMAPEILEEYREINVKFAQRVDEHWLRNA
ncbi:hypothetical protein [Pseudophaeobacter leonis]|uniref:hypothetical protein n=1 Tax=Pseudophaeobacter leonis TaxID=1144477 RepID=UPI0009F58884|nr:hypothetical protein [Pseudophaeobacter leonis]